LEAALLAAVWPDLSGGEPGGEQKTGCGWQPVFRFLRRARSADRSW
jgi:hypothetical protein